MKFNLVYEVTPSFRGFISSWWVGIWYRFGVTAEMTSWRPSPGRGRPEPTPAPPGGSCCPAQPLIPSSSRSESSLDSTGFCLSVLAKTISPSWRCSLLSSDSDACWAHTRLSSYCRPILWVQFDALPLMGLGACFPSPLCRHPESPRNSRNQAVISQMRSED